MITTTAMPTLDDYLKERVNILVHVDHTAMILNGTIVAFGAYPTLVVARAQASSHLATLLGFPDGEPPAEATAAAEAMDYVTNTDSVLERFGVTWEVASAAGVWLSCRNVRTHHIIDDQQPGDPY